METLKKNDQGTQPETVSPYMMENNESFAKSGPKPKLQQQDQTKQNEPPAENAVPQGN